MLKKILIVIVVLIAAIALLALYADNKPDDFRYERSATFDAPAEAIFPHVNSLQKWQAWSPWAKIDPNAEIGFSPITFGVGSIMTWSGNREIGKGKMSIIESRQYEFIKFMLDFEEPMQASNTAEFTFKPQGDKTIVTWAMYGKSDFLGKFISVIFNCEKMMNEQFDKGLKSLQEVVAKQPAQE